jgi:hypothetical protein
LLRGRNGRDCVGSHLLAPEHGVKALGACFLRERVVRDHPGKADAGEHHDGRLHGEPAGDLLLQGVGKADDAGVRAGEDDIAALDVGGDLGVPEGCRDLPEICHRHLVPAADVNAAQQGNVSGHLPGTLHQRRPGLLVLSSGRLGVLRCLLRAGFDVVPLCPVRPMRLMWLPRCRRPARGCGRRTRS